MTYCWGGRTAPQKTNELLVLCLEFLQAFHQGNYAILRHCVINGGAQTADGLMTLEVFKAGCLGVGNDFGIEPGQVDEQSGTTVPTNILDSSRKS